MTVHSRPTKRIAILDSLCERFNEPETLKALSDLTGLRLHEAIGDAVTCWQAGSFLEAHTDHDKETKLIVSVSLTTGWRQAYGGSTIYAWKGLDRVVRVDPQCNKAVLFTPFAGSAHWVEQVSQAAPSRRRFTWSISFA